MHRRCPVCKQRLWRTRTGTDEDSVIYCFTCGTHYDWSQLQTTGSATDQDQRPVKTCSTCEKQFKQGDKVVILHDANDDKIRLYHFSCLESSLTFGEESKNIAQTSFLKSIKKAFVKVWGD